MKIEQLTSALTPAQLQFLETKVIEGEHTPEGWISLLEGCSNFDAIGDRMRAADSQKVFISGALLFVSLFFMALPVVAGILALAGIAGLAIFIPRTKALKKLDIELDLHKFCLPVLAIVREDMAKGAKVHLKLDLRGSNIADKQTKKPEKISLAARGATATVTGYQDEWFAGDAPLRDGSRMRWRIVDDVVLTEKTKVNPRGKTKRKKKYKRDTGVYVQVKFMEGRYNLVDPPTPANSNGELEITRQGQTVKVYREVRFASEKIDLPPDVFIDTVGQAFRLATPIGKVQ